MFYLFLLHKYKDYGSDSLLGYDKKVNVLVLNNSIQNINEDDIKDYSKKTFLSEKDSSAKGFITKEKGKNWLNSSVDFMKKGEKIDSNSSSENDHILTSKNSYNIILKKLSNKIADEKKKENSVKSKGNSKWNKIPDKYNFTKKNAVFINNNNRFSYNTRKFADAKYFRDMCRKISHNWFPPVNLNAVLPRNYDSQNGGFAPGRTKFNLAGNQTVKLYFILNREGKVIDARIVDSTGNKAVDKSCIQAIIQSESFGSVPKAIKGEEIIIPFVFYYIVK